MQTQTRLLVAERLVQPPSTVLPLNTQGLASCTLVHVVDTRCEDPFSVTESAHRLGSAPVSASNVGSWQRQGSLQPECWWHGYTIKSDSSVGPSP